MHFHTRYCTIRVLNLISGNPREQKQHIPFGNNTSNLPWAYAGLNVQRAIKKEITESVKQSEPGLLLEMVACSRDSKTFGWKDGNYSNNIEEALQANFETSAHNTAIEDMA